ncbi:hypothetical protein ERO13_D05G034650v2 [Gossypium hirsutum]|nr:hypothetical protein ERO13_D05G034650v2 [Gossypium hirsutum]
MILDFGAKMLKNSSRRDFPKEFQRHRKINWRFSHSVGARGPVLGKILL